MPYEILACAFGHHKSRAPPANKGAGMPTLTLTDEDGKQLLSSDLTGQGLGKYLQSAASLKSAVAIAQLFAKPLADATGARTLALALDKDVPVGAAGELSISADAN